MLFINDQPHPYKQKQSLAELLLFLNIDAAKGIAVALNNKVVPRSEWENCTLNRNDKIILIKATQGG